jgi:hypothetical protein
MARHRPAFRQDASGTRRPRLASCSTATNCPSAGRQIVEGQIEGRRLALGPPFPAESCPGAECLGNQCIHDADRLS